MDWMTAIQRAADYVEAHLTEDLRYDEIARQGFSSEFHFQRMFGLLCGCTLGEYIRNRRLTLAGTELACTDVRVIDVALKYGYDSPDSFAKAFRKFHGITPTQARRDGVKLRSFSRLSPDPIQKGGQTVQYRIEERESLTLVGYKRRFTGAPIGASRFSQEENFYVTTRAKQWILSGASQDYSTEYNILQNFGDDGYDFYIAFDLDAWTRDAMYRPEVTGVDFMAEMGFEALTVPKQTYAVFETEPGGKTVDAYRCLRERIASDWLPSSGYRLADAPEVIAVHWRPYGERSSWKQNRRIEIRLPIER